MILGLLLWAAVTRPPEAGLMVRKISGEIPDCPALDLLRYPRAQAAFAETVLNYEKRLKIVERDDAAGLLLFRGAHRSFWVKNMGTTIDPRTALAYLVVDHDLLAKEQPDRHVQQGDVVLDVGGHVGTFVDLALRQGASKVIAVEPDPVNIECLRRNFATEIRQGRVLIAPVGAWSDNTTLEFAVNDENSAAASFVRKETHAAKLQIPVRKIDDILSEFAITRVDFIKMDIEGAERDALKGAAQVLAKYRPRMMLDAYHRPDDQRVLPELIRSINPAYGMEPGRCEALSDNRYAPHVVWYY